jgi:hypothetical protein
MICMKWYWFCFLLFIAFTLGCKFDTEAAFWMIRENNGILKQGKRVYKCVPVKPGEKP